MESLCSWKVRHRPAAGSTSLCFWGGGRDGPELVSKDEITKLSRERDSPSPSAKASPTSRWPVRRISGGLKAGTRKSTSGRLAELALSVHRKGGGFPLLGTLPLACIPGPSSGHTHFLFYFGPHPLTGSWLIGYGDWESGKRLCYRRAGVWLVLARSPIQKGRGIQRGRPFLCGLAGSAIGAKRSERHQDGGGW